MKKTLSILLVTVATLTMAACGNTATEKATTQSVSYTHLTLPTNREV